MKKVFYQCIFAFLTFLVSCSVEHEPSQQKIEKIINEEIEEKFFDLEELSSNGFNLRTSSYSNYNLLGHGYDVTKNHAVEDGSSNKPQVIDIAALESDNSVNLLFTSPINMQTNDIEFGENAYDFSSKITSSQDLNVQLALFGKKISSKFSNSKNILNKFNSKFIYGSHQISYRKKSARIIGSFSTPDTNESINIRNNYLNSTFLAFVNSHTPQEIVQNYGTHVLVDVVIGAAFELSYQAETNSTERLQVAEIGLHFGVDSLVGIGGNQNFSENLLQTIKNGRIKWTARGGNPSASIISGEINLNSGQPINQLNLGPWEASHTESNYVLIDVPNNGYVPIYFFVTDITKRNALKSYIDSYLVNNSISMFDEKISVIRYYNHSRLDHLYTIDSQNELLGGYIQEGTAFFALSYKAPQAFPVYRFYGSKGRNHYYIKGDGNSIPATPSGYVNQGIVFYAYGSNINGAKPVYELYKHESSSRVNHLYTIDINEKNNAVASGYQYLGIKFYALP